MAYGYGSQMYGSRPGLQATPRPSILPKRPMAGGQMVPQPTDILNTPLEGWRFQNINAGRMPPVPADVQRQLTPSAYGTGQAGSANGYVSVPGQAAPLFRGEIRNRVYGETMAPSQQGPYGSLGGSSGRLDAMRQAAMGQQSDMGAGPSHRPWNPELMARIESMRPQRGQKYHMLPGLANGPALTPDGQYHKDPVTGQPGWVSPEHMNNWMFQRLRKQGIDGTGMSPEQMRGADSANQAARRDAMAQNRQAYYARRAGRPMVRTMGNLLGGPQSGAADTGGGTPFNPEASGWTPPAEGDDADARQASLEGLAGELDNEGVVMNPNVRSRLGRFNQDELRGLQEDSTGWGPGGDSLWDSFAGGGMARNFANLIPGLSGIIGPALPPASEMDPNSEINRKRRLRKILGEYLNPQQAQQNVRPVGLAPAQGRPQTSVQIPMGNNLFGM